MGAGLGQNAVKLSRRSKIMSLRRLIGSFLCLVAVFFFFYQWWKTHPHDDGAWKRIQQTGVFRIGMDASYPPFGTALGDSITGLDADLAAEIGRRLGVKVQIVNMGYDGVYDALQIGQVDALISALSFDPRRLGTFRYSRAYFDAGQVLVSRGGAYTTMNSLEGRVVAVEYASVGDEVARLWIRRLHRLDIAHFTTSDEAIAAVATGKADAALVDAVAAHLYGRHQPGLAISPDSVMPDYYAIAMRLTSFDLAGAIDYALRGMEEDGTLDAIIRRWL